jgi:hypothetical protein
LSIFDFVLNLALVLIVYSCIVRHDFHTLSNEANSHPTLFYPLERSPLHYEEETSVITSVHSALKLIFVDFHSLLILIGRYIILLVSLIYKFVNLLIINKIKFEINSKTTFEKKSKQLIP